MLKIAEWSQRGLDIKEKASSLLCQSGKELYLSKDSDKPIKVVFAGQYSAGKSSIIRMITGNSDIAIGAGITTQETHSYIWNGIEIVDTPGIHTKLRPDHDEISYKAIMSADLLVFVITNELFDNHLAQHFRNLAIDKDRAGEMLLVVNKMERTSLGNVEEQQNIIKEDLRKVLDPYSPEQLGITFVDAQSYIDAENEEDTEIAESLICNSGYEQFIESLNEFVEKKGLTSRLTTPLYEIDGQLEECIKELQPKSTDSDIDALEENYLQQRHEIFDARGRLQQEIKGIFAGAAMKIRALGLDSSRLITENCKQEEVETGLNEAMNTVNNIIEECQNTAYSIYEERMQEIGRSIEDIEQSEFAKTLVYRLIDKYDVLPDNIKNMLNGAGNVARQMGDVIVKNAYKPGVAGGLRLANFAGGNVHNLVLQAGHAVGYKFKPWQAVKVAKNIAIGGQVLGIIGVGANVFLQIKEDRDEDKRRAVIQDNRLQVRGQFYTAASELEDHGLEFVRENVLLPLNDQIQLLDDNIAEIRNTKAGKSKLCLEMENLQSECKALILEIHSA